MIEKIREFRKFLVEQMKSEEIDNDLKNSLPPAINALMAIEFVEFCKAND